MHSPTGSERRGRPWLRLALLVLLAGSLAACSTVRLVYSNLDRAIVWRAGDYVDLNRDQRQWLRQEARAYLHWHRSEQLPQWAALLEEFDAGVRAGVDAAELEDFQERARGLFDEMLRQAVPAVTDLMAGFSAEQIAGMRVKLAESNVELNAAYEGLEPEEKRAVWRERTRDGLDRWVGRLTAEQERLLEEVSRAVEPDNAAWVEYRQRWQADLLAAFEQRGDPDAFAERILELALHRERWYTDRYREILARNQEAYGRFAVGLLNSLNDRQQRRLSSRLTGLADDFTALAATTRTPPEGGGAAPTG